VNGRRRPFQQVDVFSPEPGKGNPVAVVLDGEGLSTEAMVDFTRWTNLVEATFLLAPEDTSADYRVRIFTATGELPFAGHPTLGSCHAWLSAGGRPRDPARIVQDCGAGLVPIRRIEGRLAFEAPPLLRGGPVAEPDLERAAAIMGLAVDRILDAQWVDNGLGWLALRLASAEDVLAVSPAMPPGAAGKPVSIGLVGAHPAGSECALEVRAFFSDDRGGLVEDPVTGSLNASVAEWLVAGGVVTPPYVASQGTALGRTGRARISQDPDGAIWVAGDTHTIVTGEVAIGR
jgi:PhzF family phenazine biosynthesis protein